MIDPKRAERYRREGYWRPETLPGRLERTASEAASRTAFIDGDRRISFGELNGLVERLAGHLAALGARPGTVVSWLLPNWWEAVVCHHAILRTGAIPNPLNAIFRARELRFVLGDARPVVLVVPETFRGVAHAETAARLRHEIPGLEQVVVVRGGAPGAVSLEALLETEPPAPAPPPSADPSAVALLLYTSGTTSDPKGVLHSHETLLYEIESLREVHRLGPGDCYLGGSPVGHIAGLVYGLLMPVVLGTRTAFLDRWDPGRALELIERERCTFQTGAPTFLQTLADHPDAGRRDLSSFRLFSTGGASIPAEVVRAAGGRLGCLVKRAYGSTEIPTLTATRAEDPDEVRLGTDGRPIGPAEIRVVEPGVGRDLPGGEEGEIWARSPETFLGYRNPSLDREAFALGGWYRTGDLGRLDPGGRLLVTGRLKDVIIRGGENISAKEVEDLIASHPAVAGVAVVGMPDPVLGERACAFVELRPGARPLGLGDLVSWLEAREIARQKLPERLEILPRLPRTASGKIRKADLRSQFTPGD